MKNFLHRPLFLFFLLITASGAQAQVTQLSDNTNIRNGFAFGSLGILTDNAGALWRTDGTAAGTIKYTTKVVVDTSVAVAMLDNKIYFNGISLSGEELWVTDGTDAGTHLVKDIVSGAGSSSPTGLIAFNNAVYFFASTATEGAELWKSDGTDAGTSIVKDINPGTNGSYDDTNTSFLLWGNTLYFNADNGTHGTELWKSDGTNAGTVIVKDINPGEPSSNCQEFTGLGSNILFSADDGTHGVELWKSNGTDAGTVLVQDIVADAEGSSPQQFVPFNNKLFFLAVGGAFPFGTYQLFLTDGTDAGTTLVKDFGFGAGAVLFNSVIINSRLYFTGFSLSQGAELWSSDGTPAGTDVFIDIYPGSGNSSFPLIMPDYSSLISGSGDVHTKLFNGKIFFAADNGTNGYELWITDGTTANTQMVKDINPGADSSLGTESFSWFYTADNLFFIANDGTAGNELHKTDGTNANTAIIADINPGANSSDPFLFMAVNNHLYFTADDGDNATGERDLYVIDEEVVLPVTLLDFTATLSGKAVDLKWATSTETNTKNFVIQRSNDAVHFNDIGSITAAGSSTTKKDYGFIDAGAFNAGAKIIYYRLKMVDNDGKFSNSKIAKVEITAGGNAIAVYPNPAKDRLTVVTSKSLSNAIIKITDQSGKIVWVQKMPSIQAGEKNTINIAKFGSGIYYLQLIAGSDKQTTRFIKY